MPEFTLSRATTINAPAASVHAILNDFHEWARWSPWEDKDPNLERTFSGSVSGVGARYDWTGNREVGTGRMEITASTPERIEIDLQFLAPFKMQNLTVFDLAESDGATRVTWTMSGKRGLLMSLMGKLFFDKYVVRDFEEGFARLKAVAEG